MRAAERLRKANRMLVIDKKATGRKITEQMERSGKNVYEMAKAIGSQAKFVQGYMDGVSVPPLLSLIRMSDALGVYMDELIVATEE